ncbi:hypothetical protein GALMADRAFT_418661 [Galerina marginata CBS 339.88]|uniref:4Fe-4S ferredoxin-type domain-containing protein n=1 Tax=Galerina marginata (strain CBS 339.88) TaxID=685588 RepID=A0A067TAI8_GALM3|nr:hypothetical protein GALMADRAFT_418661 [Galerina marginata CBS 339.88]
MKLLLAAAAIASLVASTYATPQTDPDISIACTNVCYLTKPNCPVGEFASGGPNCWTCCRGTLPTPVPICSQVCIVDKPICLETETLTGSEGCWGCCKPTCGGVCSKLRPICLNGYTSSGVEGCWGCCPIVVSPLGTDV